MNNLQYLMVYLADCGVNQAAPEGSLPQGEELEALYRLSKFHSLDALIGMTLQKAGVTLPQKWSEGVLKAVRKNMLFDAEREKLLAFFESKGIWYMPMKGILLKELYPAVGMRQMADNDILFDDAFAGEVQEYMESQGYAAESVGNGVHDVYKKAPVYNFELHRALYGEFHPTEWVEYYTNVKERLVATEGTSCGYHFTDEDFYVYMITHEYKHYKGSGTGLRSLLDVYVYLKAKAQNMDFAYIQKECEILGVAEFEKQGRSLCQKVFGASGWKTAEEPERLPDAEEQEMLYYYLTSGVYGTEDRRIANKVKELQREKKSFPKLRYLWNRLFPGAYVYKIYFPLAEKHPWLLPVGWLKRTFSVVLDKKSQRIMKEVQKVKKVG